MDRKKDDASSPVIPAQARIQGGKCPSPLGVILLGAEGTSANDTGDHN